MNLGDLVTASEEFATKLLAEQLPGGMFFHNLEHTKLVVKAVKEIAQQLNVGRDDLNILQIAAWFHDTGYCFAYQGHEERSLEIAINFLKVNNCDRKALQKVTECIGATKVPQRPQNLLQQVMCDADMYHLATRLYWESSLRLKAEWETVLERKYTNGEWLQSSISFLAGHEYFTSYGKGFLQQKKLENIDDLLKRI